MTNEEFNRKIEFIVSQQAQFSAGMIEIREAHTRTEQSLAIASDLIARATKVLAELAESQKQTSEELVESHKRTDWRFAELAEAQRRTDKKFEELAESQKRTDEWVRRIDGRQRRIERELDLE